MMGWILAGSILLSIVIVCTWTVFMKCAVQKQVALEQARRDAELFSSPPFGEDYVRRYLERIDRQWPKNRLTRLYRDALTSHLGVAQTPKG